MRLALLALLLTTPAMAAPVAVSPGPAPHGLEISLPQDPQDSGGVPPPSVGSDHRSDEDEPEGVQPVPEPATFLLVGTGLIGLAVGSRRWRRTIGARSH